MNGQSSIKYYHHAKFDIDDIHSVQEIHNVKVMDTARWPNPDHVIFFHASQKLHH